MKNGGTTKRCRYGKNQYQILLCSEIFTCTVGIEKPCNVRYTATDIEIKDNFMLSEWKQWTEKETKKERMKGKRVRKKAREEERTQLVECDTKASTSTYTRLA